MSFLASAPRLDQPVSVRVPGLFAGAVRNGDVPTLQLLIGGEWRAAGSGEMFDVRSPIDGTIIARAQKAGRDDVMAAIAAAKEARADFRARPAAERLELCEKASGIMAEHLDTFIDAIVMNLGKTPSQAKSEANATRERLGLAREEVRKIFGEYLPGDWIPDTAGKAGIVLREPVGTVAAIGPFNYPLFLAASKIIPALAAGNTVVAKAPSDDPLPLAIRLEYAEIVGDHDRWTDDENRFAISVDPDGGGDGFVPLGEIAYRRDAPFTQNWGDAGPTVGPLALPGTSPRIDVRLDMTEADPWGRQVVATAVFRDVMLSDDLDGMDYYEGAVPLARGARHVFRISLNGVTSRH